MPIIGSAPSKTYQRTDGTRTGATTWQQAKAAAVKVRAQDHDTHDGDISDALNSCLFKDGGNFGADMDTNGYKFTGVGNAAERDDFAAAGQVQDNSLAYATTSGNDTIVATLTPAITAYAAGQLFALKLGGTNTGAATLNINTVGAKSVKKGIDGSLAMEAGDLPSGRMALFGYDGTNMQHLNAPEFPSGTQMLFAQTAAPTGWTKDTNYDEHAIRVVSGTASSGGTVDFTTAFASQAVAGTVGGTSITQAQLPASRVFILANTDTLDGSPTPPTASNQMAAANSAGTGAGNNGYITSGVGTEATVGRSSPLGSGDTHTHSFSGTAINLDVNHLDVIMAVKD